MVEFLAHPKYDILYSCYNLE